MIDFLTTFFAKTYELLSTIRVPGFNISILTVMYGSVGALLSISLLRLFFGLGNSVVSGGSSLARGAYHKGGNNNNIKISDERKGDKK